ncbi:MAG: TonB-dependent receptor [Methylomonas sp.]|nr:TonB-dependent receptor [Methylomonas sp.]
MTRTFYLARTSLVGLLGVSVAAVTFSIHAQEALDTPLELDEVKVTGSKPAADRSPQETVLQGDVLKLQQADTLGKTLENQMGLANASFGAGVGIPVIRGLTGSRVRFMQDSIGSHDASFMSPDHAVAIEPLFAETIEVVRGPATIRYGGNAIGGMVNVKDERIPERVPENWVGGAAETRFDTNADGTHGGFKLDLGKDQWAMRVGGFHRNRNDTEIPGEAIDMNAARRQFRLDNDGGVINTGRTVPNTDSESLGGSWGLSWLGDSAMVGMSIGENVNRYGIPKATHGVDRYAYADILLMAPGDITPDFLNLIQSFPELAPDVLNPDTRIDMRQTRYDFKGEWYPPLPGIEKVSFRYGDVDYTHTEFERELPFTTYANEVGEGRFEIEHKFLDAWSGTLGAQWQDRDFAALGVETFVPQTRGDNLGLFTVQKLSWQQWQLEAGLRTERVRIDPTASFLQFPSPPGALSPYTDIPLPDMRQYRADSASLASRWHVNDDATLALTLSRAKRAPDIQELLSAGPHLATRTFAVGNVGLRNETVNLADLGLDIHGERLAAKINGYYNWTENYIYQQIMSDQFYDPHRGSFRSDCVSMVVCLPVYGYQQRNAEFMGYEAETKAYLAEMSYGRLSLTLFSDWVIGRFADGDRSDVPRLPPLRLGAEIGLGDERWSTAIRYTRAQDQNRPGLGETETEGYHLLAASADYHWRGLKPLDLWLFAKANNLLNQEVRSAVSFLRTFAPEPGRSVVIGFRATY